MRGELAYSVEIPQKMFHSLWNLTPHTIKYYETYTTNSQNEDIQGQSCHSAIRGLIYTRK